MWTGETDYPATHDELVELICAVEPARFARERLGFEPDGEQERLLTLKGTPRVLLNCTRQWGKSTVAAAKAVHQAYFNAGSLTLVVSPCARQSGEFLRKASGFVRKLGLRVRGDGDNDISRLFPNGARIVGLPGTEATVRGFSAVALLLIDEAARVADEMYKSVRPMLAVSGGDLWLMSTPYGKRGFFYEEWVGKGKWHRVKTPATECPRIGKEFLEQERAELGERWFGRSIYANSPRRRRACSGWTWCIRPSITRWRRWIWGCRWRDGLRSVWT